MPLKNKSDAVLYAEKLKILTRTIELQEKLISSLDIALDKSVNWMTQVNEVITAVMRPESDLSEAVLRLRESSNRFAEVVDEGVKRIQANLHAKQMIARAKGGASTAAINAKRYKPAIDQYLRDPRLQEMSFEAAAMVLINRHNHHVVHSVLKRRLSKAKKSMSSA